MHLLRVAFWGHLGPGERTWVGGCHLLGTRNKSWGGTTPSDLGAEGGSGVVEWVSSSALGVCDGTLFSEGALSSVGALVEAVAGTPSFLNPPCISCSLLNKSPSSTTGARNSWTSCNAPQNMSGGALAQMVHHWSTMASVTVSSFCTSQ